MPLFRLFFRFIGKPQLQADFSGISMPPRVCGNWVCNLHTSTGKDMPPRVCGNWENLKKPDIAAAPSAAVGSC